MLKDTFNGKRVLFIGVKFYDYHLEIKRKMEEYGASVSFFSERDTSIKYGIVNRLFHSKLDKYQELHYSSVLKKTDQIKFDYLFVIRGFKMPLSFVKTIKKKNPGIKCIMYQWDANTNSPFINLPEKHNVLPEFEKIFSFDFKDVEEHRFLKYSPTFHTDEFLKLANSNHQKCTYDFFYFGSYLPERYAGLLKFREFAEAGGHKLKTHFYMSYRYYQIEKLKGTVLDKSVINFKPMTRQEYLDLFMQSKAIVDVSNAKQTGLAMRVIDAIGAGKKVLTTNGWIVKEPSYNTKQIQIIDIDNITIPEGFLEEKLEFLKPDYTIDHFLTIIFCN